MSTKVDQSSARADGDIVAGNKEIHHHYATPANLGGVVERLIRKLQAEIDKNEQVKETIENLRFFQTHKSIDGIIGLEQKLEKAERQQELHIALEKKELFAKLLENWSLYASAQEIFAVLLAKIEYEFTNSILPRIGKASEEEIGDLISQRIIIPTMHECGSDVFTLNHSVVMGMVYWLAEQCFVRWHE